MNRSILIFLILFSGFSFSQTNPVSQEAKIIRGSASLSLQNGDLYEDSKGDGIATLIFQPVMHYFIADNVGIGGSISYLSQARGSSSYSEAGIGPNVGYYFGENNATTVPFVALGLQFSAYSTEYSGSSSISTGVNLGIGAGGIVLFRNNLGIVFDLSYTISVLTPENSDKSYSGGTLAIGVGLAGLFF